MAQLLFPMSRPLDTGRSFRCPCHGGTQFTVLTAANIPYASCPVCGSVCEPYVEPFIIFPYKGSTPPRTL